jgi:hypothetical protein
MLSFNSQAQLSVNELPIHVSYYGDSGIHPGLKIGTSYKFWSKEKSKVYRLNFKQNKYGNKTKFKEFNVDYNLGFYTHPNNHLGLFTNVGISYLRIKERKGRMFGMSFEIGYLRRMNKFKTYQLNDNGEIIEKKFAGNNAIMFSFAPLFGKEFKVRTKVVRIFIKPSLQLVKYNEKMQPNASLELGTTFNINRK